jgi:hypothetical protein
LVDWGVDIHVLVVRELLEIRRQASSERAWVGDLVVAPRRERRLDGGGGSFAHIRINVAVAQRLSCALDDRPTAGVIEPGRMGLSARGRGRKNEQK